MDFNDIALPRPRPTHLGNMAWTAIAVLLAACSPGGAGEAAAPAGEMPGIAAGKWRISVSVDGKDSGFPMTKCSPETPIDDLLITGLPGNGSNCAERSFTENGATSWTLHSVCNFIPTGGRKADAAVTIDTRVSSDLKTRYQVESRQVMSKPMNGVSQQTIVQTGERLGDC
jgi:hypothetical protein